uniref:XK-related protein n=1 Tax=Timema douglasi TaxID=61478 RepID=A0A7R8Z982_TIMDO|nr:unnamed protein product [Timema douglasi]
MLHHTPGIAASRARRAAVASLCDLGLKYRVLSGIVGSPYEYDRIRFGGLRRYSRSRLDCRWRGDRGLDLAETLTRTIEAEGGMGRDPRATDLEMEGAAPDSHRRPLVATGGPPPRLSVDGNIPGLRSAAHWLVQRETDVDLVPGGAGDCLRILTRQILPPPFFLPPQGHSINSPVRSEVHHPASELYRQSGRRILAKIVPTLVGHMVSTTSPPAANLCFLEWSCYFFIQVAPHILTRLGVSAAASLVSLAWAVASYTRAMRRTRADKSKVSWPGLLLQALWRGGMLAARVASLVLFAVGFKAWIFLLLGVHWVGMTTWVVLQRTDLCETPAEERVYNCVVGIIYCFCFFNLQEGPTRKRALAFYIIVIGQNVSCLCLFGTLGGASRPGLFRMSAATIIGGTLLGISSMLLYYRFFHPSGPIRLCSKDLECDVEKNHKTHLHPDLNATLRSLKHPRHSEKDSLSRLDVTPPRQSEDIYTDKKLLLTRCVSSPSLPCVTTQSEEDKLSGQEDFDTLKHRRRGICSTEDLVVDLPIDKQQVEDILEVKETFTEAVKQKRRGICPLEPDAIVELQLGRNEEEKENSSNEDLMKQKRRGIYSSEDLVSEVGRTQSIESKEESLSVLCEKVDSEILRRKRRGICSSDCLDSEQVKELVVGKQTESQLGETEDAPSEVLSVPSEVLSAHDYENMCAVNIAREAWGLRSWRGYSDIETWLHDDSVVRDSRRDTLTSTVTSASSENSGSSPPTCPF